MKWLFAYDHKFFEKDNNYFSKQGFPYEMWHRYLKHCDQVIVAGRISELTETESNYSLSSGPKVSFVKIPNASNLNFFNFESNTRVELTKAINSVDAVIARVPSQIGFIAIQIAKKSKKPYTVEVVGDPKESYRFYGNWKAKAYAPLASKIMKHQVKKSVFSLYITERELQKLYPTEGFEYSCSNVDLTNLSDVSFVKRREERRLSNKVIFGMIGSLDSDYKGLDVAIKALAMIKLIIPNFEFRILGSGDTYKWKDMVKQYHLEKNITFCGTIPSNKVSDWLKAIDIYIQPSRTEGQGRSVIEAMATGCPVVTSDVGGMKELVEHKMRFSNGDSEELAQIVYTLVKSTELYKEQINKNYSTAKKFSKETLEQKRATYYKQFKEWIDKDEIG